MITPFPTMLSQLVNLLHSSQETEMEENIVQQCAAVVDQWADRMEHQIASVAMSTPLGDSEKEELSLMMTYYQSLKGCTEDILEGLDEGVAPETETLTNFCKHSMDILYAVESIGYGRDRIFFVDFSPVDQLLTTVVAFAQSNGMAESVQLVAEGFDVYFKGLNQRFSILEPLLLPEDQEEGTSSETPEIEDIEGFQEQVESMLNHLFEWFQKYKEGPSEGEEELKVLLRDWVDLAPAIKNYSEVIEKGERSLGLPGYLPMIGPSLLELILNPEEEIRERFLDEVMPAFHAYLDDRYAQLFVGEEKFQEVGRKIEEGLGYLEELVEEGKTVGEDFLDFMLFLDTLLLEDLQSGLKLRDFYRHEHEGVLRLLAGMSAYRFPFLIVESSFAMLEDIKLSRKEEVLKCCEEYLESGHSVSARYLLQDIYREGLGLKVEKDQELQDDSLKDLGDFLSDTSF